MAAIVRNTPRDQAVHTIMTWIETGRLERGMPLPAETDLADRLSVSRGTARAALEQLEDRGVLERQGRKRFVAEDNRPTSGLLDTVALLGVADEDPQRYRGTGYVAATAAGAMEAIASRGGNALTWHPRNLSASGRETLLRLGPSAVLVFEEALTVPDVSKLIHEFSAAGLTVVISVDDPDFADIDRVIPDFADGNRQLVHRLAERGCRRILPLRYIEEPWWQVAKDAGYAQGIRECGLSPIQWPRIPRDLTVIHHITDAEIERTVRVFAGYLAEYLTGDEPVDAIMVSTDWQVPLIAQACHLLGREPGSDLLLTGFDNKFDSCAWRHVHPATPTFTVDKRNSALGAHMVDLAFSPKRQEDEPRCIRLPIEIIEVS